MHVKETKVRLPLDTKARIEALVGKQRMAEFIRDAVEEKLVSVERAARRKKPDA